MNSRISIGFTALGCILLASCYPYDESARRNGQKTAPPQNSVTTAEQQKIKEQRDLAKKQDEIKKKAAETAASSEPRTTPATAPSTPDAPKPPAPEKKDFAYAQKVPGKDGFVFSPFNNKVIDVRDIPSGTLVQDPTYPASEMKRFRVP